MAAHEPAVIDLNLQMPVMDGRTFFRELRARGCDIPVLILSAYGATIAQHELQASASLNKPSEFEELLGQIRQLVQTHAHHMTTITR